MESVNTSVITLQRCIKHSNHQRHGSLNERPEISPIRLINSFSESPSSSFSKGAMKTSGTTMSAAISHAQYVEPVKALPEHIVFDGET